MSRYIKLTTRDAKSMLIEAYDIRAVLENDPGTEGGCAVSYLLTPQQLVELQVREPLDVIKSMLEAALTWSPVATIEESKE